MCTEADSELETAESALQEGDLAHALHHLANALVADPLSDALGATLKQVARLHGAAALELLTLDGSVFAGRVGLRALFCAHAGQADTALALMLRCAAALRDPRLLQMVARWTATPAFIARVSAETAATEALSLLASAPNGTPDAHRWLGPLLEVVENVRLASPREERLAYTHSLVLRRLGRIDEAMDVAERVLAVSDRFESLIGLASAYREGGRLDDSLDTFRRALAVARDNVAVRLDVGDLCLQTGRLEDAVAAYSAALEMEPGQPWAIASIELVRYQLTGRPLHIERLEELAQAGNERAAELARAVVPHFGWLPRPADAIINVLLQLRATYPNGIQGGSMSIAVSGLEAPSARLALDLWASSVGMAPFEVTVERIAEPDPRRTWERVSHRLWAYAGTDPRPEIDPPRLPAVIAAVSTLAAGPYDSRSWYQQAAASTPGDEETLRSLLACMVHPPPSSGAPVWEWLQAVQFAAAMMVARIDPDRPWHSSLRRAGLHSLLHGPTDWTTSAAIVALACAASDGTADLAEARLWLQALADRRPSFGYWCIELPLVGALMMLAENEQELAALRAWRRSLLDGGAAAVQPERTETRNDPVVRGSARLGKLSGLLARLVGFR